jgi:hypothetical protein
MLILAPLGIYTLSHWDTVMGRPGQVGVFNPLISGGDPWGTLIRQLVSTLGMFFIRGDAIPRHNLPGRPVFDPLMGLAMLLGLVWGLRHTRASGCPRANVRSRWRTPTLFALIWVGLMLIPTWLAEDAPHFLRAVGVLPLLTVFPALGIEAIMSWVEQRKRPKWAIALACIIVTSSLAMTVRDYFVRYRTDPQIAYAFEAAATELAAEANRFTGIGWGGNGLAVEQSRPKTGTVYIDGHLWDEWEAIPFLVPKNETVIKLPAEAKVPGDAILLLLWPYDGLERCHEFLPHNAHVEAHGGPLARGDLEEAPYEAYIAYAAKPANDQPTGHLAKFGDQIALIDYVVENNDQELLVHLTWEALESPAEDYTVFVHLRDGEKVVAQDDAKPAMGYYPTSLWRKGDVIVDTHVLNSPTMGKSGPHLVVGLYILSSMEHLEATTPTGELLGNELMLPLQTSNE